MPSREARGAVDDNNQLSGTVSFLRTKNHSASQDIPRPNGTQKFIAMFTETFRWSGS
jgi:hypothetical protein